MTDHGDGYYITKTASEIEWIVDKLDLHANNSVTAHIILDDILKYAREQVDKKSFVLDEIERP